MGWQNGQQPLLGAHLSTRGPRTTFASWHPLGSQVGSHWHLLDKRDHTCTCPVSRWGWGLSPVYEARVLWDTLPVSLYILCPGQWWL